jgi:hypothetical protein
MPLGRRALLCVRQVAWCTRLPVFPSPTIPAIIFDMQILELFLETLVDSIREIATAILGRRFEKCERQRAKRRLVQRKRSRGRRAQGQMGKGASR